MESLDYFAMRLLQEMKVKLVSEDSEETILELLLPEGIPELSHDDKSTLKKTIIKIRAEKNNENEK